MLRRIRGCNLAKAIKMLSITNYSKSKKYIKVSSYPVRLVNISKRNIVNSDEEAQRGNSYCWYN